MIKNMNNERYALIISAGVILLLIDAFFLQDLDLLSYLFWFFYLAFAAIVLLANKN